MLFLFRPGLGCNIGESRVTSLFLIFVAGELPTYRRNFGRRIWYGAGCHGGAQVDHFIPRFQQIHR